MRTSVELSIDTSTRYATVGLSRDGNTVAAIAWRSERNHSVELVPAIQRVLAQAHTDIHKLSSVYVAVGPGGFSALRVGMSTAIAIATACEIGLVAVGTLDIEARPFLRLGYEVRTIVGAGRGRLYLGEYASDGTVQNGSGSLVSIDDFLDNLADGTIYCGEAVNELGVAIKERLGQHAMVADTPPPTRNGGVMAMLGYQKLQSGDCANPRELEPVYLKSSQVDAAARRWRSVSG